MMPPTTTAFGMQPPPPAGGIFGFENDDANDAAAVSTFREPSIATIIIITQQPWQ